MQKIMDISKKQFNELKLSFNKLLKNKTFYVYLLLAVLLVPALFFEGFIYPVIVVAVVASVFFNIDDTMALALFLYPFFSAFVINGTNFDFYSGLLFVFNSSYKTICYRHDFKQLQHHKHR